MKCENCRVKEAAIKHSKIVTLDVGENSHTALSWDLCRKCYRDLRTRESLDAMKRIEGGRP